MTEKIPGSTLRGKATELWKKVRSSTRSITLEPAMFLDGISYSIMIVSVENIQMEKICLRKLNYTQEICANLSAYPEEELEHQKAFSVFGMYYGILTAILPLFFVLFIGAWSDKYGRKPPLIAASAGHILWALCYMCNAYFPQWPAEMLFLATILDTLGGGTVTFLTVSNAYISDVTKESERTCRVGLANSIWFLGGPLGTFIGTYIYKYGGYLCIFGISATCLAFSLLYILHMPESRGPYSQFDRNGDRYSNEIMKQLNNKLKEEHTQTKNSEVVVVPSLNGREPSVPLNKMIRDLVDYNRIIDCFKSTFRKREGHARMIVLLLIMCNLLRRLGRGAYMYLFTRMVLQWGPTDYGIWVSYKNLLAALGSLVAVPVLSLYVGVGDNVLALIGAMAATIDYAIYGLVTASSEFLIWLAPIAALLVNSCVIAIRAMLSKFVPGEEIGKVSAVMGALDGLMPMVSFSLYTLVYKSSVHVFPGAQFFFGSSANILCTLIFIFIICYTRTKSYGLEDLDTEDPKRPVTLKGFRDLSDEPTTEKPQNEVMDHHSRMVVGVLSGENFHIASTYQRKSCNLRQLNSYAGQTLLSNITNCTKLVSVYDATKLLPQRVLYGSNILNVESLKNSCKMDNTGLQHLPLVVSSSAPVVHKIAPFTDIVEQFHTKDGVDNPAYQNDRCDVEIER